jgi:hypothetical protein
MAILNLAMQAGQSRTAETDGTTTWLTTSEQSEPMWPTIIINLKAFLLINFHEMQNTAY